MFAIPQDLLAIDKDMLNAGVILVGIFEGGVIRYFLRIEYDNELTYGLNLGLDYAIKEGGPWVITGGLRYLGADLEGDGNVYALNVDPLEGFIGLGYRW